MVHAPNLHLLSKRSEDMQKVLGLYWGQDVWDITDPFFDPYRTPRRGKKYRYVRFFGFHGRVADELKYFLATRLASRRLALGYVFSQYAYAFAHLAGFLAVSYPGVTSLGQLPYEKVVLQWRSYLAEHIRKYKSSKASNRAYCETALKQALTFFQQYYDTREEWDKDEWNLRAIPGAKVAKTRTGSILRFETVPSCFRALVKRYVKVRIERQISQNHCWTDIQAIGLFLTFVHQQHPDWFDLGLLSRGDIEDFLAQLAMSKGHWIRQRRSYVIAVRIFLDYMQSARYPEAPTTPVVLLLQRYDVPRIPKASEDSIKYIPENVLQQLETQLERLSPIEYIPIVVLLRASGWRISDILNLRYDTCLDRTDLGWYLHVTSRRHRSLVTASQLPMKSRQSYRR